MNIDATWKQIESEIRAEISQILGSNYSVQIKRVALEKARIERTRTLTHEPDSMVQMIRELYDQAIKAAGISAVPPRQKAPSPRCPVEVLPPAVRQLVEQISSELKVPADLPMMAALGILAAVAGPRMRVEADTDWLVPPNMYAIVAMPTGSGKTPAMKPFFRLLDSLRPLAAEERRSRMTMQHADLAAQVELLEANRKDGLSDRQMDAELKRLKLELETLEKIMFAAPLMRLGGNATTEGIEITAAENEGYVSIVDDESTLLRNICGQYSSGQISNVELHLKGWDGDRFDSIRRGRANIHIDALVETMFIGMQPGIVRDAYASQLLGESGFLHRIMCIVPEVTLNLDPIPYRRGTGSVSYEFHPGMNQLRILMENIIRDHPIVGSEPDPGCIVRSCEESFAVMAKTAESYKRRQLGDSEAASNSAWISKGPARMWRVAGLLHLLWGHGVGEDISAQTMELAVAVEHWAYTHQARLSDALCASGTAGETSPDARVVAEYLDQAGEPMKRSQINRDLFRSNRTRAQMLAIIEELEATGRYQRLTERRDMGRPAEMWGVK